MGHLLLSFFIDESHVLIRFNDDNFTSVVPVNRITPKDFSEGSVVTVRWSDLKHYSGTVLAAGLFVP